MNLEKIITNALPIVYETGRFLQNEIHKVTAQDIKTKQTNDFVTYVDKTAERQLVEGLKKVLPEAGFLTEEKTTEQNHKALFWIIDPLDGTTNYIHRLPFYSISIALQQDDQTVGGIVYEVSHDELFYAWQAGGAFLNKVPIHTSSNNDLAQSLLATGFPFRDYSRLENYSALLTYLMQHTRGLRRLGSAAIDLVYTACGRFDGFFEYGLAPWDVAAGACIVKEAGGMVSDFSGKTNYLYGEEILASASGIFQPLLQSIQQHFHTDKPTE